jgi:hypothetical protein
MFRRLVYFDVAAGERQESRPIRARSVTAAMLAESYAAVNQNCLDRWEFRNSHFLFHFVGHAGQSRFCFLLRESVLTDNSC